MKCPVCKVEFGYLHLDGLDRTSVSTQFDCPHCATRLNNLPILRIEKKLDAYVYGAFGLLVFIPVIELLIANESMSNISVALILGICPPCPLLGYLELKKMDSTCYGIVEHDDI